MFTQPNLSIRRQRCCFLARRCLQGSSQRLRRRRVLASEPRPAEEAQPAEMPVAAPRTVVAATTLTKEPATYDPDSRDK